MTADYDYVEWETLCLSPYLSIFKRSHLFNTHLKRDEQKFKLEEV